MEVKINREISNYKETVFWGMTLSQFVFAIFACSAALGMYFLFRKHMGTELLSWICMFVASPFVAFGFIRVHDMSLWDFIWVWLDFVYYIPQKLNARPSVLISKNEADRRL